jgi:hypothetical protein
MRPHRLGLIAILILNFAVNSLSQNYLSNLNVNQNDPIYTTYAASLSRSEYKVNKGYKFVWYDPEKCMSFESAQAGELGVAFKLGGIIKYKLSQFYKHPVITTSFSDLVKYYYFPFKMVKVEATFLVYSSRIAIREIKITNESAFNIKLGVYPFIKISDRYYSDIKEIQDGLQFKHNEYPDGWMKDHNIPFQENITDVLLMNEKPDGKGSYDLFTSTKGSANDIFLNDAKNSILKNGIKGDNAKIISLQKSLLIPAGESVKLRIIRGINEAEKDISTLIIDSKGLFLDDLEKYVREDEKVYSKIPLINFKVNDFNALYWNAFSLMRQCMLPPEGECHYNYYVFSREPRWGWGYGGQVFHESLSMLAYVYMDPQSAMNSQRVYMERQHPDGYINYRTGPYLNETIPYKDQLTTSAPWFNWENWEIYKVAQNKKFLEDAYQSGKKLFEYFLKNRDSNNDGLCEWGGDGELESVRDARVAVWDKVGNPSNFDDAALNFDLVKEAKSLEAMANELGLKDESKLYKENYKKRTALINKYMWDPETKFYYNINKNNHSFTFKKKNDLKRKEIIAFLALWSGVANKAQAKELVKHLTNQEEFWRNYGVPSLSADDSYYVPIGYWNGPVWTQWQYLISRGLIDYGYKNEAKELVKKVLKNVDYQLSTNHWFWEFYSADDLQAGWNKTYIWAGIIARMLIDYNSLN